MAALTLAEIQSFINFVNGNIGKKVFTDENPSNVIAGKKLLTSGVGLGVDFVDDISYQLGIIGNWDVGNTLPPDLLIGQRYIVTTAGTYNGVSAQVGDLVEFITLTSIFVYPTSSSILNPGSLANYTTKTYVDNLVTGLLDDRGSYNPTLTSAYPTSTDNGSGDAGAIMKGDIWFISTDGIMGNNNVLSGYSVRALVDEPGQTDSNWDILNVGLGYVAENVVNKKTSLNGALDDPNDTDYPTTKVVDVALDLKANILDETHTGNMRLPSSLKIYDTGSPTREVVVDVGGLTAGLPRTVTFPDRNIVLGDLPVFTDTTNYKQYAFIQHDGLLYSAKIDFTSGTSFNVSDWDSVGGSGALFAQVTGNRDIVTGYEYFMVPSTNNAITLETPDPSLVPDGSKIIIHNLGYIGVITLGKTNWTTGTGFAVAPSFAVVTTASIPSYSTGATTVLTSRQATGAWVKETTYGSTIPVGTTVGDGKVYFAREDDVTATVSFDLGDIPASTNKIVTFPNADIDLGKVAQPATNQTDGYLSSADWNTFNSNSSSGFVAITNIAPASTSDNVYGFSRTDDDFVLASCTSSTRTIKVSVLAVTGASAFKPTVTVDSVIAGLSRNALTDVWEGYAIITLPEGSVENIVTATHSDGPVATCAVTVATGPVITSFVISDMYLTLGANSGQTEHAAGQTVTLDITADTPINAVEIVTNSTSAAVGKIEAVGVGLSASIEATIADRGNTTVERSIQIRVRNTFGTWSTIETSSNTVNTNNIRPLLIWGNITYSSGFLALKDTGATETATVEVTASNIDTIEYTSPGGDARELLIVDPLVLHINNNYTKTVSRLNGNYNITTDNLQATANRTANATTDTFSTIVKIAHEDATLTISTPGSRLRSSVSGASYTITMTASQLVTNVNLDVAATTVEGDTFGVFSDSWAGGWTTTRTRTITIRDSDKRGATAYTGATLQNLAGKVNTATPTGNTYTIGGFTLRQLSYITTEDEAAIGTNVLDVGRVRVTSLAHGPSGTPNLTYQNSLEHLTESFTITGPSHTLNQFGNLLLLTDADFVTGRTQTVYVEIEEEE